MRIIELPERVLGLEGAGVVRRVGSRVKALRVGDRVATVERGAFSTLIRTLEILCVKVPDEVDLNEAATLFLPFVTAMHSLMTVGGLKKRQVRVCIYIRMAYRLSEFALTTPSLSLSIAPVAGSALQLCRSHKW